VTPASWLLEVVIDGRTFRSSTTRIEVDGVIYTAGLDDLQVAAGTEQVSIAITDPSIDWPALARFADGGAASLSRTRDGVTTPITSGELRVGSWGARTDPFQATIDRRAAANGVRVPDTLARVGPSTWPLTAEAGAGVLIGDVGRPYPVIFGYPGFTVDDDGVETDPYPVVPIPLAQRDDQIFGTSKTEAVVAEDGALDITSIRVYNAATTVTSDEDVDQVNDNLGRSILRLRWPGTSSTKPIATDQQAEIYAGFSTSGGGGPRSAYDVLVYLLKRWGGSSVDWSRIPEVEAVLERYLVDTWIDEGQTDPWSWFSSALLPFLPVDVRTSDRGRYLVELRYRSDPRRRVRTLSVDRGEATLTGALGLSDTGPYNEFVARYRPSRDQDWRSHVTLTSSEGIVSATKGRTAVQRRIANLLDPHNVASSLCARSLAQYGPQPAEPVDLDWCWDDGTALAVLQWMAERDALPAVIGTYDVRDGDTLREGDEVELTDSARGFEAASAIVAGPPVLTSTGATIDFRIPP
jgi:hypothetical protein